MTQFNIEAEKILDWRVACGEEIKRTMPGIDNSGDSKYAEEVYREIVDKHRAEALTKLTNLHIKGKIEELAWTFTDVNGKIWWQSETSPPMKPEERIAELTSQLIGDNRERRITRKSTQPKAH